MAEVIGNVIHGGKILVRVPVGNMFQHLPPATRRAQMESLIAEARRLFPWAPSKLEAKVYQAPDYHHYLLVEFKVPAGERAAAIRERMEAAENTRCACGCHGSWDRSVSGTSRDIPCVWAGCTNCTGTAIGRPILAADLTWYERANKKATD